MRRVTTASQEAGSGTPADDGQRETLGAERVYPETEDEWLELMQMDRGSEFVEF